MSNKNGRAIRADLNEERIKELDLIKKEFGIESDAEIIRFLIKEKFKEINKKE